jgi:flagellar biosynthesis protein
MTNDRPPPKTIAVALEEQPGEAVPMVTATGRGFVAEQILAVAFANGVKVREDADLVQILAAVDVDSEIPTEAFAAVSEILTYVYRANGQLPPDFSFARNTP